MRHQKPGYPSEYFLDKMQARHRQPLFERLSGLALQSLPKGQNSSANSINSAHNLLPPHL